ncbi:NAD(P)/FAD-dependent oxidoreductase [Tsukamurella sp. 8F]|uniref:NAD(P)/FAD-dependent oxidoreductase n=1 Tax=unclassified Tsukamurella TaxID=2633480 RepID=UPI0023B89F88|nr:MULTISPECIES: NAD(P)/FAD-dependent oxidoreductase [unclassified Tsukamurella]MDF0529562.1 NAD(P)/FAD-dependent oxidoreductase [Tsukamurella sp. 8J]MDF0585750.1 NAD(P)/FAD-dependent oxidoreductase [Tsukamurella sp. 8F]
MTTTQPVRIDVDVVIVGSGFGALAAAQKLAGTDLGVLVVSKTTEHLFQPLLYQVATGVLAPGEIAPPIRSILGRHKNIDVRLGEVIDVDADAKTVTYRWGDARTVVGYRYLVAATGASQSYFGHPEFAENTFALKTIDDALTLRDHILANFELAHALPSSAERDELLSFVVVGAGATGVELAGQIRELARRYFDSGSGGIPADDVRVVLVDGAPDVLPVYGGKLSEYTARTLRRAGVDVRTAAVVTAVDDEGVELHADGRAARIPARTVVWSAGVEASGFAGVLAAATGCAQDRAGRLLVGDDLTVGGHADVFAIGDMTSLGGLPGQSPVAMQQGRHAACIIAGKTARGTAFRYLDKGSMATIDRFHAVASVGPVKLTGVVAWMMWLAVHLLYLVGFRNRYVAVLSWFGSFVGKNRPHFHLAVPGAQVAEPAESVEVSA